MSRKRAAENSLKRIYQVFFMRSIPVLYYQYAKVAQKTDSKNKSFVYFIDLYSENSL